MNEDCGRLASAPLVRKSCEQGGLVMAIDPNNPFNFSYPPGQNFWGTAQLSGAPNQNTHGATHSWSSISAGTFNTADNFFAGSGTDASSSPFNYGNSLSGFAGPGDSYVSSLPDIPSPVSPTANGGSGQSGPDSLGDVTVVNTAVGLNPTFAADNVFGGTGSIGLYGRSRGTGFSIGVMGQTSNGCGMLGLATDENSRSLGIGVVGRSMGGHETEAEGPDELMASAIGVLGQSALGTGVRGHGGPLLPIPVAMNITVQTTPGNEAVIDLTLGSSGVPTSANIVASPPDGTLTGPPSTEVAFQPNPSLTAGKEVSFEYTLTNAGGTSQPATVTIVIVPDSDTGPLPPVAVPPQSEKVAVSPIGGVFSSGQLGSQRIPLIGKSSKAKPAVLQQVSQAASAQLQLVPFVSLSDKNPPKLPVAGQIGDLFLCVIEIQKGADVPIEPAAQLWICTGYEQDKATGSALPRWQPVQMGVSPLAGGTPIPLTATPWA
jgi:Big-like domain-containing protein